MSSREVLWLFYVFQKLNQGVSPSQCAKKNSSHCHVDDSGRRRIGDDSGRRRIGDEKFILLVFGAGDGGENALSHPKYSSLSTSWLGFSDERFKVAFFITLSNGSVILVDPERDRLEQVHMLIGFFVEAFIYAVYCVLFFGAVHLMRRRKTRYRGSAKIVFALIALSMFIVTTVFTVINIYRFVVAYALVEAPMRTPILFFKDFKRWENYTYVISSSILLWIADMLVIYRCFIIWERNRWVIAAPLVLLIASIAINAVNIYWFQNPTLSFLEVKPLLDFVYPGHLAQNVLTTALIAYKMWQQHRISQASGLAPAFNVALLTIMRIIVESALIYTLQLTTLVVLYFMQHPAVVILQAAIVPSIGIVFVLMFIRVHMATIERKRLPNPSSVVLPAWIIETTIKDEEGGTSFEGLVRQDIEYVERTSRMAQVTR